MPTQPKKILIIEDSEDLRRILSNALGSGKVTVLEAKDGAEGLEKALTLHPDLILLDIVLPKMDGLTMLKTLRKDEWGREAPVVILTNLSDARDIEAAMGEGARDYLVKIDWKLEDIISKVQEKLRST